MPNNSVKTLKNVRNADAAHPYSRKATQINRANLRTERLAKSRSETNKARSKAVDRIVWFKYAVDDEAKECSKEQLHELIDMFISRNDDEIETLTRQLRKGRPKPSKLLKLELIKQGDVEEYNAGIEVPDFTDPKTLAYIRTWEADYNTLHLIKMIRLRSSLGDIEAKKAEAMEVEDTKMDKTATKA